MELFISVLLNVVFVFIIIHLNSKSKEVEEKTVYVPEIRYRDKIEYQDRVVYQDRIVEKYVPNNGNVIVNNNIGNTKKVISKTKPKKIKEKVVKPVEDVSPKKLQILKELEILKSKNKKTKQDLDNIYTLEMILPNIK